MQPSQRQTSVTAGTVMHAAKLVLGVWLWRAELMATHANGFSALQLQKQLGLGCYTTAWLLRATLRSAMVAPDRPPSAGLVTVDQTTISWRSNPPAGTSGHQVSCWSKSMTIGRGAFGWSPSSAPPAPPTRTGRARLPLQPTSRPTACPHSSTPTALQAPPQWLARLPGTLQLSPGLYVVWTIAAHIVMH